MSILQEFAATLIDLRWSEAVVECALNGYTISRDENSEAVFVVRMDGEHRIHEVLV